MQWRIQREEAGTFPSQSNFKIGEYGIFYQIFGHMSEKKGRKVNKMKNVRISRSCPDGRKNEEIFLIIRKQFPSFGNHEIGTHFSVYEYIIYKSLYSKQTFLQK